jgi:hypothetical protein
MESCHVLIIDRLFYLGFCGNNKINNLLLMYKISQNKINNIYTRIILHRILHLTVILNRIQYYSVVASQYSLVLRGAEYSAEWY